MSVHKPVNPFYIELAPFIESMKPSSSLRLCREFEKKFPDIRGCQLELMKYLCSELACEAESYLEGCVDAWRRTIIYVDPDIFSAERCKELAANVDGNARDILFKNLVRNNVVSKDATMWPSFEFRSNILPGEAYMERLLKLESQSFWTRVHDMMMGSACSFSKRGFFPKSILDDQACLTGNKSLVEVVNTWREKDGGRCCLARHLKDTRNTNGGQKYRTERTVREIRSEEVIEAVLKPAIAEGSAAIAEGSAGRIDKVLWNNRTYARKSLNCREHFNKERRVASRLCHPHLATAFGCSTAYIDFKPGVWTNAPCLLMELMTSDLFSFANEQDVANLRLSRTDSIDVLLQIGMALDHMHTNNVVHGDLKPQNILQSPFEVSGSERYLLVKVSDFDTAHFINPDPEDLQFGVPGYYFGTFHYSAPEVLNLKHGLEGTAYEISEKLDVYSFGAVAYEILTRHSVLEYYTSGGEDYFTPNLRENVIRGGLRLVDSKEWRKMIEEFRYPHELIELVENCLELDPRRRPTFTDICESLKECKSTVQLERQAPDIWKRFGFVFIALIAFIYCALNQLQIMRFLEIFIAQMKPR